MNNEFSISPEEVFRKKLEADCDQLEMLALDLLSQARVMHMAALAIDSDYAMSPDTRLSFSLDALRASINPVVRDLLAAFDAITKSSADISSAWIDMED